MKVTLAWAWLAVVVLFMLAGLMWLAVNAPAALITLAQFSIALLATLLTLVAAVTVINRY